MKGRWLRRLILAVFVAFSPATAQALASLIVMPGNSIPGQCDAVTRLDSPVSAAQTKSGFLDIGGTQPSMICLCRVVGLDAESAISELPRRL